MASKPAPAMTPKRSLLNRPTSSRRRSPCRPISTACSMSCGIRGWTRGDSPCRPEGSRAPRPSPRAVSRHRWTVPSPPQTKISSAPALERALDLLEAPRCSSAPRTRAGRRPLLLELAPKPEQAVAERLAGVGDHRDDIRSLVGLRASSRRAAVARLMSTSATSAAIPSDDSPETSSGWCIPRYIRRTRRRPRPTRQRELRASTPLRAREVTSVVMDCINFLTGCTARAGNRVFLPGKWAVTRLGPGDPELGRAARSDSVFERDRTCRGAQVAADVARFDFKGVVAVGD